MMILPQLPLYAIALICGLLSLFVTRLSMPRIIKKLEAADIVGKDIHKSWRPVVAEMGGFGILFGFIIGMFSGIYMHDLLAFKLAIVLVVILLVGIIGIVDDLLALSSKEKFFLWMRLQVLSTPKPSSNSLPTSLLWPRKSNRPFCLLPTALLLWNIVRTHCN